MANFTIPKPDLTDTLISADGVKIYYEAVGNPDGPAILLANGLGGSLSAWSPLVNALRDKYRLITWDYRGLFRSGIPDGHRGYSIERHAEDGIAVLRANGYDDAYVFGWSMGVQVGLEIAAWEPDLVNGLILLNGTHGHTLETGYQLFFRIPWMRKVFNELIEFVRDRPQMITSMGGLVLNNIDLVYWFLKASQPNVHPGMKPILACYLNDVFATDFGNFLRLFQEMDAHSVYHLLREIDVPALVISGGLDMLTPPYQSKEMARKMPHAQRVHFMRSSHFTMLEHADKVIKLVGDFFGHNPPQTTAPTRKPKAAAAKKKAAKKKTAPKKKAAKKKSAA